MSTIVETFIEEKNNAYKMSSYLLPSKKGPKINTIQKTAKWW
jgi:hypothetical protein